MLTEVGAAFKPHKSCKYPVVPPKNDLFPAHYIIRVVFPSTPDV